MVFNSIAFFIFLPLIVLGFYALPHRLRWIWLLLGGFVFYGWWKWEYLSLLLALLMISFDCFGQFYFGYNRSFLRYNMKGLSFDFARFNESGSGHTKKMQSGDMEGYSIGLMENMGSFVVGFGIRQRRYTTEGERETAPRGFDNYKQIRMQHSALLMDIGFRVKEITLGYEIEFARLRLKERDAQNGEWQKMTSNQPIIPAIGLFTVWRPQFFGNFHGFFKGYWRPSTRGINLQDRNVRLPDRIINVGQFGVELGFTLFNEEE